MFYGICMEKNPQELKLPHGTENVAFNCENRHFMAIHPPGRECAENHWRTARYRHDPRQVFLMTPRERDCVLPWVEDTVPAWCDRGNG